MGVFDSLNDTTEKASDIGERYIDKSRRYFKLKIFQQLTFTLSLMIKAMVIGGLCFIGIVFSSIALAMVIGDALGSLAYGYLSIAGIYIIFAIIFYLIRSKINIFIIRSIGKKYFE